MENESIEIRQVKQEDFESLFSFYQEVYPERADFLKEHWKWLYRTSFLNNRNPYVAILNNRVIGHFGSIPFVAYLNSNKYTAQWFVDFALLPEFRGRKIGPLLSEALMKLTDLCITCCNQHSIKVFKRQGWTQATNAYLHFIFLRPLNHIRFRNRFPAFLRSALNGIFVTLISAYYKIRSGRTKLIIEPLSEENYSLCMKDSAPAQVFTTRLDKAYLKWRFLDSPDRTRYKLAYDKNGTFWVIIKTNDIAHGRFVDIMLHAPTTKKSLVKYLAFLALWAGKHDYNYLHYYTSDSTDSARIKKSLFSVVQNEIYAYYSQNPELMSAMDNFPHKWYFCDSDYEKFAK